LLKKTNEARQSVFLKNPYPCFYMVALVDLYQFGELVSIVFVEIFFAAQSMGEALFREWRNQAMARQDQSASGLRLYFFHTKPQNKTRAQLPATPSSILSCLSFLSFPKGT
jgi:hypothetical protein